MRRHENRSYHYKRRTRISRVRILFMLYLFEFFELNNLHVVMVIIFPIIDFVHPIAVPRLVGLHVVTFVMLGES